MFVLIYKWLKKIVFTHLEHRYASEIIADEELGEHEATLKTKETTLKQDAELAAKVLTWRLQQA
jgi:hypothetical protein